jgi:hypothetical protein
MEDNNISSYFSIGHVLLLALLIIILLALFPTSLTIAAFGASLGGSNFSQLFFWPLSRYRKCAQVLNLRPKKGTTTPFSPHTYKAYVWKTTVDAAWHQV